MRNQLPRLGFLENQVSEENVMSVWFKDDGLLFLRESAVQIAWDFLERAGEIDDPTETSHFLADKIEFMIGQGQRNRLMLSNRAIAEFQRYKLARTIESSLLSG